ncbi:MAG: hypothetical protein ACREMY_05425, partial [bacterium]
MVSLSTQISGNDSPEVSYQILLDGTPIPGSHAGAGGVAGTGGFYGNAIIVQQAVAPGQHTICLQWRVTGGNMSACIDPNDANHGMHASLLVESCDGISLCI